MAAREGLGFEPPPQSDCAPLSPAVTALRNANVPLRAVRDATRGGVAAVLHEWAETCGHTMSLDEARIPVSPDVAGACELLGLDPLHVANEGTMLVAVPSGTSDTALAALRTVDICRHAAVVGHIEQRRLSPVLVVRGLGRAQPLDEPLGALLPRIC
jgi:hydrogenase expression/formation protein HypE